MAKQSKRPADRTEAGRDRPETEKTLMAAVGRIVREKGFLGLGINALAEEAGVSKVLIYRYFGNLDGLIEAWALANNYWGGGSANADGIGPEGLAGFAERAFAGQIRSLRGSAENREILRWFLAEENPLSSRVMSAIEERGKATMAAALGAAGKEPTARVNAGVALIIAGIYYLALISDRAPAFNGLDLGSDADWSSIGAAARDMALSLLAEPGRGGEKTKEGEGGRK